MKFSIAKAELERGLKSVGNVIENRNTIPVLGNVKITAKGGSVSFCGTNLDLEVTLSVPAEVTEEGATTVGADVFERFASRLPTGAAVKVEFDGKSLLVSSGRSKVSYPTLPVEDFPEFSMGEFEHRFDLTSSDLLTLFSRPKFAISTEETRYYLNGIYMHRSPSKTPTLRGVATDGHRLAQADVSLPEGAEKIPGVIVPRRAIEAALKLSAGVETVGVELSGNRIRLTLGDIVLASKLIYGTFPDYARVIPDGNNKVALVPRKDLSAAAERVTTVSSERGRAVKMSFGVNTLELSVSNPDAGSAVDEVDIKYDADPLIIGFNSRYLADILREIGGDEVRMAMADPGSPAVLRSESDAKFLAVLMPMRV